MKLLKKISDMVSHRDTMAKQPKALRDIEWLDNATFEIGGHKITMNYEYGGSKRKSAPSDFTMMKSRSFLDQYLQHKGEDFRRILEMGVYQGGSFVFLDQVFNPDRISAIELAVEPIPALDAYVEKHKARASLYYGTSQDDVPRLAQIIDQDFGGELDLVVDDASHFYDQTKAGFAYAFPRLRPGGLYIIEDWSWSFFEDYQREDHPWAAHHSLANLAVDLMEEMALGGAIEDMIVSPHMIKVRRSQQKASEIFKTNARRGRNYQLI
ncbi:class I SAM-dependent methyltransferase [Rhizobium oryziradicis]|uniref:class I SAM-dependent methyltransferase n=1 Tax=Rhizobium oryziradicis TaxID=1867956 RepID=UPI000AB42C4B|nr:class I SAM-dependent methyltransferase [Rhizobium oryziradicis]